MKNIYQGRYDKLVNKRRRFAQIYFAIFIWISTMLLPFVSSIPETLDQNYFFFDNSIQAEYYFNEGFGSTTRDDSGNGNTMNLISTNWVAGRDTNFAIEFVNPSSAYVNDNNNLNVENSVKWCIYFNIKIYTYCNANTRIFSKYDINNGGLICEIINGVIYFQINPNIIGNDDVVFDRSQTDLIDNLWHFIGFSYEGGIYRIHIDPSNSNDGCVAEKSSSMKVKDNNGDLILGEQNSFFGRFDDYHWTEIVEDFPWMNNTVGYWTFDENYGPGTVYVNDRITWNHEDKSTFCNAFFTNNPAKGISSLEFQSQLSSRVEIPHSNDLSLVPDGKDLYIELWYYKFEYEDATLIAKTHNQQEGRHSNGYKVYYESLGMQELLTFSINNKIGPIQYEGKLQSNIQLSLNQWYHLYARYYDNIMYLDVFDENNNMIIDLDCEYIHGIGFSDDSLFFGYDGISTYYSGILDEIIIGKNKDIEIHHEIYNKHFNFNMDSGSPTILNLYNIDVNQFDVINNPPSIVSTTPYGRAFEFNNNGFEYHIYHPYSMYDNNIHIEIMVFPYFMDVETTSLIISYESWKLIIEKDANIKVIRYKLIFNSYYNGNLYENIVSTPYLNKENTWSTIGLHMQLDNIQEPMIGIYLDGVLYDSSIIQGDPLYYFNNTGPGQYHSLYLGSDGDEFFRGILDEFTMCSYKSPITKYRPINLELPVLKLDFNEGGGPLSSDQTNFNNNAYLGESLMYRAANTLDTSDNDYKIYKYACYPFGFPLYDAHVTIIGGTNQGMEKEVKGMGYDQNNDLYYIYVDENDTYPDNIDDSTIYYLQNFNPNWDNNGISGNCIDFDDVDYETKQYIKIPYNNSFNIKSEMTMKFDIKPFSNDRIIFSNINDQLYIDPQYRAGQFQAMITNNNKLKIDVVKDIGNIDYGKIISITSNSTLTMEKWYKIQFILKDQMGYIYINGQLDKSKDLGVINLYPAEEDIFIGSRGNEYGYHGMLDNFEIYNYALKVNIIKQHFTFDDGSITIDSSYFSEDCEIGMIGEGPTINNNGKYGKCVFFNSNNDYLVGNVFIPRVHTFEAWIKIIDTNDDQIISVCPYSSENYQNYPVVFGLKYEQMGNRYRLYIQTSTESIIYSKGFLSKNYDWTHVAYSIEGKNSPHYLYDTINMYINGFWDSKHFCYYSGNDPIIFEENLVQTEINKYYIGGCPDNIWGDIYQTPFFHGFMDEVIITSGYKNFREDRDSDGISDCYEISRSYNSIQYNSMIHNSRIAILMAPIFHPKEIQFTYDITMMRHYLSSNGWKDEDVLFMSFYFDLTPEEFQGEWIYDTDDNKYKNSGSDTAYWLDGCPYKGCLKNILDALEYGGPACIYHQKTTYHEGGVEINERIDEYHIVPKLDENDIIFIELRNHGVGYKDDPRYNGDVNDNSIWDKNSEEWDFGWRNGRCRTVLNGDENHYDEHEDFADISEQEFAIELYYFMRTTLQEQVGPGIPLNNDPIEFPDIKGDPNFCWLFDINHDSIMEEIYLVQNLNEWWWRLYINGTFREVNHTNGYNPMGNDQWDAQVKAAWIDENNTMHYCYDYNSTSRILHLTGVDLNQDDIHAEGDRQGEFSLAYIEDLDDYIDIDEGFATHEFVEDDPFRKFDYVGLSDDLDYDSIVGGRFQIFKYIWWDTDLKEELENISYKESILLLDFCYSGGFVNDLKEISSIIMTSSRETDTSYRYNVMFYSRIKGENEANYYIENELFGEDRGNHLTQEDPWGRDVLNADGVSSVNNNRDIIWDQYLIDYIISFNEAAYFTSACLANKDSDMFVCPWNKKWPSPIDEWKTAPIIYIDNGPARQLYL
ncbi:MAG: hypothetical protein QCI82_04380 [Candidatus Thermoplasmatota archaeon]|nr:hypothetical protein [Candidatus Thermoplasmatota archaeon]